MLKPIIIYNSNILRNYSEQIKNKEEAKNIIIDLWDTLYNAEGAGLAAPQIGINKRIFVIDILGKKFKKTFINPIITKKYGEINSIDEGCLSIPGLNSHINRQSIIDIEYYDELWEFHKETYDGLYARVIQHEYDHLEGILWIDHIDVKNGIELISKLKKIISKEIEVKYPIS